MRGCVTMIGLVWERGNFRTLSLDSQHCPRKRECWRDHALEGASSYGQAQGGLWPWPAQQTLRPGQRALSCPSVGGATAAQAREAAPTVHGPQTVWLQGTSESRAAPASHCLRGAHALLPQGAEGFHSPPQHPNANPAQLSVRRAWLSLRREPAALLTPAEDATASLAATASQPAWQRRCCPSQTLALAFRLLAGSGLHSGPCEAPPTQENQANPSASLTAPAQQLEGPGNL